ncbi:HlyD family efflux transporter periplasmic adaptor subunit [Fumia xinanensis]|uniref:RND related alpha-helical hairpin domain-containing protein n=1 Tax=Fumia xinanensis TaxID=2763659 RepID=A0A926E2G4_9FIRM|nr:HlyD family efflux transporter periplasmic adaptor subunit [Fumia xinanensis]MBC8558533.1 hypothetical protein [Fumia xinanensis]
MNSDKVIKISTVVLSAFVIIYVICQMFRFGGSDYATQTVYEQTVNDTIPVEGIIFRDETVISVGGNGIISCNYAVGEKVSTKTQLGSVYQNQAAIDEQRELKNVEQTLETLQKIQQNGDASEIIKPEVLNSSISEYGERLITSRDTENFSKLSDIRTGLTETYAKRNLLMDSGTDYTETIQNLMNQRDSLKAGLGGTSQAFYSTAAGYFVDHVDGQEEALTESYMQSLTAGQINDFVKFYQGYQADSTSVKIVKDHNWYYAVTVSEEHAKSLRAGSKATLQFPTEKESVPATVQSVDFDEASGLYKVVFLGDTINDFLLSTRVQSAEVLVSSYKGLKVPKEAIRFKDDEMGVYIKTMNKVYFRKLDKLYETDDFVISRTYYDNKEGYLELYDDVIVKGKDLYDQKPV